MVKIVNAPDVSPLAVARQRFAAIRAELAEKNIGALYVTHLPSIRYLTNFSGSNGSLLLAHDFSAFFTDDRYAEQVKTELYALQDLRVHIERDPVGYIAQNNLLSGINNLGFDPARMNYSAVMSLRTNLKGTSLKRIEGVVERQTMKKAPHEAALIRKAGDIQHRVFNEILPLIKPGVKECDLAAEIVYRGRKYGAEKEAFDIIALAGDHSAWVHGRASDRTINNGEMITFDFGFFYQGFASDVTRTVACGEPGMEARKVYEIVRRAHAESIAAARAGIGAKALDAVARDIITAEGYGDYFKHTLGHGLGIEVHEAPGVSYRNTKGVIPESAVVTIEPGFYLPGKFGVRIEDDVWITSAGCEILSSGSSELIIL